MKYGIRAMLEGGAGGSVVNIASEAGLRGMNGVDGYTAATGGVIALTSVSGELLRALRHPL